VKIDLIADEQQARVAEFRRRNVSYEQMRVTPSALPDYAEKGWTLARTNKSGLILHREKPGDAQLEDRFWCCLYRLGYPELNEGRQFKIEVATSEGNVVKKQIDIFAKDDETVIVAECKTAETLKKKSLQKDIGEFESLKKPIAEAIRRHYGRSFKPKILWAFVISNIEISENDRVRINNNGTQIITERDLRYIEDLSRKLGPAGRQQFLAEYLGGQKIPALQDRRVPAVRVKLGGMNAFVFSARASEILKIAFVNHRDLKDPQGVPSYQRLVNKGRLSKISAYLSGGGFFPNSILINFKTKIRFDIALASEDAGMKFGYLYLPETYKSCMIVDGQHRLYGCSMLPEGSESPHLIFIAFERMPNSQEAILFATINREQKAVDKKLLDELDGDLKWDSEDPHERIQAIASRAIDLLSGKYGSPFLDRVVPPGFKTTEEQPLTLPEVRKAIISAGLLGRMSGPGRDKVFAPGPFSRADSESTLHALMDALDWYFKRIAAANLERWEQGLIGRVCNNFGIPAHLRFFGELIRFVGEQEKVDVRELSLHEVTALLEPLMQPVLNFMRDAAPADFEQRFNVTLGSGGVKQYLFKLYELVHQAKRGFAPAGLDAWVQQVSQEEQQEADRAVKWVQDNVHRHVVEKMKFQYGPDFFDKGIKNKSIQKKALEKRVDEDGEKQPPEVYLDFMDLKVIVEQSENWPLFQSHLHIPLPGQRGVAKCVRWFDEINRIRRVPAHPYGRRYTPDDLATLRLVIDHLKGGEASNG
jgi:DGQHR domain-containing protein